MVHAHRRVEPSTDSDSDSDSDIRRRARRALRAREAYLSTGAVEALLRPLVLDSWRRSLGAGVNPETSVAPLLTTSQLTQLRAEHPLAPTMPLIRRLLLDTVVEAGLLLALSDAAGRLLWVEGHSGLRSRAEGMLFVEGADWSESAVGTNAPGTALALDQPVQIFAAEHLSRPVTPWSCSAAPIHDPDTGAVMGVLDLTGGDQVATPQSLSLVRATVAAVEAELQVERLRSRTVSTSVTPHRRSGDAAQAKVQVLGAHQAILQQATRGRTERVTRLSPRHSEILLLLVESGDGLSAAELSVALSERDVPEVTVRAELSRLRAAVEPLELLSRPYRLAGTVRTDLDDVREALAAADCRRAVSAYRGPALPFSEAPAVVELREDLHQRLRAALLQGGDPDALLRFGDTAHGREDFEIWQAALRSLPPDSPRRDEVASHLRRLLSRFG